MLLEICKFGFCFCYWGVKYANEKYKIYENTDQAAEFSQSKHFTLRVGQMQKYTHAYNVNSVIVGLDRFE